MKSPIEKTIMELKTENLTIRPAQISEMEEMIAAESDEGLRAAYTEMLTLAREHPEKYEWYIAWQFIMDGNVIGDACFKGIENGVTEIGYGIKSGFEGRGYTTQAVRALTQWAFDNGADVVEAETDPDNAASQRIMQKLGFLPTGKMGEEGPRFALKKHC